MYVANLRLPPKLVLGSRFKLLRFLPPDLPTIDVYKVDTTYDIYEMVWHKTKVAARSLRREMDIQSMKSE